ncbi:unnamed protein product [Hyaloperonospora brassicae]|uniref:MutL C-terminal dimerisation domain-containing protein n=1 Tax=Hyaloperonospora brassicae TaxID=162125 RepID=A0AAV0U811_HYABA|nr:unnamed protein product [Hyaloperonospora brassicae]
MEVLDEKTRRIMTASYALPDLETAVQQVIYNAIDAHAKTIKLVVDMMTASFTAVDDGCGIHPDSLYAHVGECYASAKFPALERKEGDEIRPESYGSRGAFLYALTSLATTVEIESRAQEHWSSYRKVFQEGKVVFNARSRDLRQATGTKVCVSNMFGKLPVRHKDLSRNAKYRSRVTKGIKTFCVSMSMIWPPLSFDVQYQGGDFRPVSIPAAASCLERFSMHFGDVLGEHLQYVSFASESLRFSIRGYFAFIPGACEDSWQGVKQAKSYYQFAFLENEWVAECQQVCSQAITEAALALSSAIPIFVLKVTVAHDQYDACRMRKEEGMCFKAPDEFRQFLFEFVQIQEPSGREVTSQTSFSAEPEHEPPALIPSDSDDVAITPPGSPARTFDYDTPIMDVFEVPVSVYTDDCTAFPIMSSDACQACGHVREDTENVRLDDQVLSYTNKPHRPSATTRYVPETAEVCFTSTDDDHGLAGTDQSEDDLEDIFFSHEPSMPLVESAERAGRVEVSRPMLLYHVTFSRFLTQLNDVQQEAGVSMMPWLSSKPDAHDCADLLLDLCQDSNYNMDAECSQTADQMRQHIECSPTTWNALREEKSKRPLLHTPAVVKATSDYFLMQKVERSSSKFLRRRLDSSKYLVTHAASGLHADNVRIMAGDKMIKIDKSTLAKLQVIRQVDRKFILVRADTSQGTLLLCIDQHAADERVRLEKLEKDVFGHDRSLREVERYDHEPPLILHVNAKEHETMQYHEELITGWGFKFECLSSKPGQAFINVSNTTEFDGGGRVALHATPQVERRASNVDDFRDFIQFLSNAGETYLHAQIRPPVITRLLHSRACRSAIMFGDRLSLTQCQDLIEELKMCHLPFQCAHGRPSVVPLADIRSDNVSCGL